MGEADCGEELCGACVGGAAADCAVGADGKAQWGADGEDGVQRHQRVLEHHGDAGAAEGAHVPLRFADEFFAAEADGA